MKKLTKKQILLLHRDLIITHGGSDGIRDSEKILVLSEWSGIYISYVFKNVIIII